MITTTSRLSHVLLRARRVKGVCLCGRVNTKSIEYAGVTNACAWRVNECADICSQATPCGKRKESAHDFHTYKRLFSTVNRRSENKHTRKTVPCWISKNFDCEAWLAFCTARCKSETAVPLDGNAVNKMSLEVKRENWTLREANFCDEL